MIPYGRQSINDDDISAVEKVLQSAWLTQGPQIDAFETALADYCQAAHAVAVSNGTAALHLACLALGLNEGDYLWTTPISFVASANCGRYCGAAVDFVDVDPNTGNLCVEKMRQKLVEADQQGCLPKVLVVVHFSGSPCDMKAIREATEAFDIRIIEDASHAVGARYEDEPVGNSRYSDLTVFSFHPVKIITTGEGGAVLGNNADLMDRVKMLRTHGIEKDKAMMDEHGAWYYEQHALGWNYRITDIQAALGLSQLKRLDEFVQRRQYLASRYDESLRDLPCEPLVQPQYAASSFHLYVIRVEAEKRRSLYEFLHAREIAVQVHYIPIHWQPYYQQLGFTKGQFQQAEDFYHRVLSLPMFPSMTDEDQSRVVDALKAFYS